MSQPDKQLADGLVALGMEPAQAVDYAAEHSANGAADLTDDQLRQLVLGAVYISDDSEEWEGPCPRVAISTRGLEKLRHNLTAPPLAEALLSSVLLGALKRAEAFIKADRDEHIEGACILDPKTLAPKIESLDPGCAAYLAEHHDPLLADLAAAIRQAEEAGRG